MFACVDFGMELPLKLSNNWYNKDGIDQDKVKRIIFHKNRQMNNPQRTKYI